ncbi:hypothetical protein V2J09_000105 [Rumex salicifolius]
MCSIRKKFTSFRSLGRIGDHNTSFFNASTIVRRRRDKIMTLRDENEVWIEDPDLLEAHARDFFRGLYSL